MSWNLRASTIKRRRMLRMPPDGAHQVPPSGLQTKQRVHRGARRVADLPGLLTRARMAADHSILPQPSTDPHLTSDPTRARGLRAMAPFHTAPRRTNP